ncbi:MAG: hypothetical protein WCK98_07370 [bacterium]
MYTKTPVSIRLNQQSLELGKKYSQSLNITFTELVELSLQNYITTKLQQNKSHPLTKYISKIAPNEVDDILQSINQNKKQQSKLQAQKDKALENIF